MKFGSTTLLRYLILILLCVGSFQVHASVIDGTIYQTSHTAQVCEIEACTISSTSPVNFGYFTTSTSSNVHVLDTGLTGFIWGSSFGWAVVNCAQTTSGCSGANGNFKIANDVNGNLSGYAWGETAGWINFGPFVGGATAPVVINGAGEFNGYAWSQNFGWIKFDCSNPSYCVRTDWRPLAARPQCSDTIDNDADGLIDTLDSGCHTDGNAGNAGSYDPGDNTELLSGGTGGSGTSGPGTGPGPGTTDGSGTTDGGTTTPGTTDGGTTDGSGTVGDTTGGDTTGPGPGTTDGSGTTDGGTTTGTSSTGSSTSTGTGSGGSGSGSGSTGGDNPTPVLIPPFIKKIVEKITGIVNTETGGVVAKVVTTAGAVSGIAMTIATAIFANPLTFSELFLIPLRLWSLLLAALGLKRRNRPWGTVYDSVTKQPLDPAYVILQDMNGNEVATSITDIDGRYGFLVPTGMYRMNAHKTNYEFPSKNLAGKLGDELYSDLYFGEPIQITEGGVITKNIPLDPLNFDWNEFAKKEKGLMKFYSRRDVWIARLANILFWLGFSITTIAVIITPRMYNIITFAVYIFLLILKRTVLKPRPFGMMTYKDGTPISFAVMRIFRVGSDHEVAHKVADQTGKYYALIPNGSYYVTIEQKNPDASYTLIYTSLTIEVTNGYINKAFEI